jgi:hypothetical protein
MGRFAASTDPRGMDAPRNGPTDVERSETQKPAYRLDPR